MTPEMRAAAERIAKEALAEIPFIDVTIDQVRHKTQFTMEELGEIHRAAQEAAVVIIKYNREQH